LDDGVSKPRSLPGAPAARLVSSLDRGELRLSSFTVASPVNLPRGRVVQALRVQRSALLYTRALPEPGVARASLV
jgi:hypothetical protein